ncbi:vimentin-like isoform X2 [Alosa pseudoharengus]|uniref:vimentin-like isoform X2 n=1 Tax=Alosa pseudoharengus TaxID=34774 RepID=UPI003F8C5E76
MGQNRNNEKEEMQELNNGLASYIEKVQLLEQMNNACMAELNQLKGNNGIKDLHETRIKELEEQVDHLNKEYARLECQNKDLQKKWKVENQQREETELLHTQDKASLAYMKKKVTSLERQITYLQKIHNEEISEIQAQNQHVQFDKVARPNLTAALEEARKHYEELAKKNLQEGLYKSEEAASSETIRKQKEEVMQFNQKLLIITTEKESLEHKMVVMQKEFSTAKAGYLDQINLLKESISEMKREMEKSKGMHDALVTEKLALDTEIAYYRKLLEAEEKRIKSPLLNTPQKEGPGAPPPPTADYTKEGKSPPLKNKPLGPEGGNQTKNGTKPVTR